MSGLWSDPWFYASGAGFLASLTLLFYLHGQYKAAIEAADEYESEAPSDEVTPIEPVKADSSDAKTQVLPKAEPVKPPAAAPAPKTPAPAAAAASAPISVPAPAPAAKAPLKVGARPAPGRKDSTMTGGISPAVVYLQGIKAQMDALSKEVANLKSSASKQTAQEDLILSQLEQLTQALSGKEGMPAPSAAPKSAPAPAVQLKSPETKGLPPAPSPFRTSSPPLPEKPSSADAPKVGQPMKKAEKIEISKKTEAPKVEAPKIEAPKTEAPKTEAPKTEAPKVEAPKVEAPKVEAPKVEAPKVEAPKVEAPKVEAPKVEAPKVEAPKVEAPKAEATKPAEKSEATIVLNPSQAKEVVKKDPPADPPKSTRKGPVWPV